MMQVQLAETLMLRLDALALALAEMARALPPEHAHRVAMGIGTGIDRLVADRSISPRADASLAADLAPLMMALHRQSPPVPQS
jgi:hypothetical protein